MKKKKHSHNGILFNSDHYQVKIKTLICDVPVKNFVNYTRGNSGYFSYKKYTTEDFFIMNRISFPSTTHLKHQNHSDSINRNEEEFWKIFQASA